MTPLATIILQNNIISIDQFDEIINLPYNHERWTYAGVASVFGDAAAEGLSSFMAQAGLNTAVIAYATVGFDLSLDSVRNKLDLVASNIPDLLPVCEALKNIGRPTKYRYEIFGLQNKPSQEDWDNALLEVEDYKLKQQFKNRLINFRNNIVNWVNSIDVDNVNIEDTESVINSIESLL